MRDFPGGPVVKNPGTKIPHAVGQLNPSATTREKPAMKTQCSQKKPKKQKNKTNDVSTPQQHRERNDKELPVTGEPVIL